MKLTATNHHHPAAPSEVWQVWHGAHEVDLAVCEEAEPSEPGDAHHVVVQDAVLAGNKAEVHHVRQGPDHVVGGQGGQELGLQGAHNSLRVTLKQADHSKVDACCTAQQMA